MDRFDRIYRLHGLLSNRRIPISLKHIMEHLECSKSTAARSIETLRDCLNAPLDYNRQANGYFYNQQSSSRPYELPGLWFSAEELQGLLICQLILKNISPGILSKHIEMLQQRINSMLSKANIPQPALTEKIYFVPIGRRLQDDSQFKRICSALFSNQQMHIQYQARGYDGEHSERIISAQKLIYHRDNWYLAAYCHYRKAARIFSVDMVNSVQILEKAGKKIPDDQLQVLFHSAYGIFSGKAKHIATLEFTKARANWVADEHWHPQQQEKWLENGNYQLGIPFSDNWELIMDILKHGAEVKVIAPQFLQDAVMIQIQAMKEIYHTKVR